MRKKNIFTPTAYNGSMVYSATYTQYVDLQISVVSYVKMYGFVKHIELARQKRRNMHENAETHTYTYTQIEEKRAEKNCRRESVE